MDTITSCDEAWKPPTQNIYHYSSEQNAHYALRHAEPIAGMKLTPMYCLECGYWHHVPADS